MLELLILVLALVLSPTAPKSTSNSPEPREYTQTSPITIGGGGSVEITFDEQIFPGKNGKYGNKDRTIASVEVTDHNTNNTQIVTIPANGKCTIRITTR